VTDTYFKSLPHCLGTYRIASRGNLVCKGYKPDLTVCNSNNQLVFIFECEQKTDRKAFLGSLVKAEKYAEDCGAHPILIIVMQEFINATVQQIANNLTPYAVWLARLKGGKLNLADIRLISDQEYLHSVEANELVGSQGFLLRTISAIRISN
jgi:hypothetical protein